ncbi:hypothetical protein [Methylobacterium sp. V23]|uniref:hypothetical protein n=1 Tax=Methylobacterium sp. V23 TaxID=2044878 RepID=UPI000CDB43B3|nr:hypothetical protein [Methylobacterium sp. V23]POR42551.1 hypothetical protein CRT23_12230 [Methylobacterium sp. V23]
MTALQVHTCCQYLTAGGDWRNIDHNARVIIKAVKGEDFNGYFDAKIGGKTTRLSSANKDVGLQIAGEVVASKLVELIQAPVTLVPIPNSAAWIGGDHNFRTLLLANTIAHHSAGKAIALPALLWLTAKEKQHQQGGYRHANHFTEKLAIVAAPETPVVLIDDVITSGSQMLAATYILRNAGIEVLFGMAVGKTTAVQTPNALQWVEEKIEQMII